MAQPDAPYLAVKGWESFQHYKHRNPPWIKLYTRLIDADDIAYTCLHDASKAQLIHLWLLASRHDNKIPCNPDWLQRRLNITDPLDLVALVSAGFVTIHGDCSECCYQGASTALACCKQSALPEKSRDRDRLETETETESRSRAREASFERFWQAYPKPRRQRKKQAAAQWAKIKATDDDMIIEHVARRAQTRDWLKEDSKFVPHPDRFIRDERWLDEYETPPDAYIPGEPVNRRPQSAEQLAIDLAHDKLIEEEAERVIAAAKESKLKGSGDNGPDSR